MSVRRRHERKPPRGALLAWLAVAIQALLPFFIAVEIARASNPAYADTVVICSALGGPQHQSGTGGDHHGVADGCPICTALAATHGGTAPLAAPLPLPGISSRVALTAHETSRLAFHLTAAYRSRAPPAIA